MGRFQNPFIELNLVEAFQKNINVVRRFSGGGCVYHDLGNLNFSFIGPLSEFNKTTGLKKIIELLRPFDLNLKINERNDLITHYEGSDYKVSGSAYKQIKDRYLHHGTLLIEADLESLGSLLKSEISFVESKSLSSVRSKVKNLRELNQSLTTKSVLDVLNAKLVDEEEFVDKSSIEWKKFLWTYGETPFFRWKNEGLDLKAKKGKIISLSTHQDMLGRYIWEEEVVALIPSGPFKSALMGLTTFTTTT